MSTYYTYITTDANRRFLQPGVTGDLSLLKNNLNLSKENSTSPRPDLNRVVLIEKFNNLMDAQKRQIELSGYGRIVRERIIRQKNPNWLSLNSKAAFALTNKKIAVYA